MLNVTLYVPAASPGTVCGAFHCCPAWPSISTVAPIGMEETINCPSAGAGGATGAAATFRAALLARDDACGRASVCAGLCSFCADWLCAVFRLKGAAAPEAGFDDCVDGSSGSSGVRCWNSMALTTITIRAETTPPTSFQWFAVLTGPLDPVFAGPL